MKLNIILNPNLSQRIKGGRSIWQTELSMFIILIEVLQ